MKLAQREKALERSKFILMPTKFLLPDTGEWWALLLSEQLKRNAKLGTSIAQIVTNSIYWTKLKWKSSNLECPDIVINAAAKVGGIHANSTYPAEFIHQNLVLNSNLIHSSWTNQVSRF